MGSKAVRRSGQVLLLRIDILCLRNAWNACLTPILTPILGWWSSWAGWKAGIESEEIASDSMPPA